MQQYDSYKDSGVKWLGEIPSHWEVNKAKYYLYSKKTIVGKDSANHERLALTLNGVIKREDGDDIGLNPEKLDTYQIVESGNLIFKLIDLENFKTSRVGLTPYNGIVSPAYIRLINKGNVNMRFLEYYYLNMWHRKVFNDLGAPGVRSNLSANDLLNLCIVLPNVNEQDAIVSYLDTATAKIDAAIAQQQKMIDLLNERKQIIINRAVTKGLNPNAKMKDSGVEWIGEVPEGWEVMPLKYCAKTNSGSTPKTIAGKDNNNSRIRWVRTTDLNNDIVYDTSEYLSLKEMRSASCPLLPKDTVLISMYGGAGSFGKLGILNMEATINQALCSISCDSIVLPKYMFYYLQSIHSIWMKFAESTRKDPNLNQQTIRSISVILPSVKEQQNIVDYIESLNSGLNTAVSNIYKQISLLQERKQIIINEVVTGKVKVM